MGIRWVTSTTCTIGELYRRGMGTTCDSKNTGTDRTVSQLRELPDFRYSAEEIRFSLLAIAQRPLPILTSQLNDLNVLLSTLHSHLEIITPDWNALAEFVPAAESQVDSSLIAKTIKKGDVRDLLSLKKALDRDIAMLKTKIIDEEEKLSEYTVTFLSRLA